MPFKFPFTNYHELNLDWIIKKIEEITKIFEESSETITVYEERLADAEQDAADALAASTSALSTATSAATAAGSAESAATAAQAAATQAQTRAGQAEASAAAAVLSANAAQIAAQDAESIVQNFVITPTNYTIEPNLYTVTYDPNDSSISPASLVFYSYVFVGGVKSPYTAAKLTAYAVHDGLTMPASQVDVLDASSLTFPVPAYLDKDDYIVVKAYKSPEAWVYQEVAFLTVPVIADGEDGEVESEIIAPDFNDTYDYYVGNYVWYNGKLYKFNTDHTAGAWNSSEADEVCVVWEIENNYADFTQFTDAAIPYMVDNHNNKAPVIISSASGAIASFPDGADQLPIEEIICSIVPVQSGSGTPAPDNVRPISGNTGMTVNNSSCLLSFVQGGINDSSGTENTSTMRIRSDYIPVSELSQTINVLNLLKMNRFDTLDVRIRYFYWYTSNKTFIENSGTFGLSFPVSISAEDIPSNTGYFRIVLMVDNVTVIAPDNYRVSVNAEQPISISWQTEAGTVYGGNLTINEDGTGVLTVTKALFTIDGSGVEAQGGGSTSIYFARTPTMPSATYNRNINIDCCDQYPVVNAAVTDPTQIGIRFNPNGYIYIFNNSFVDLETAQAALNSNPVNVVVTLTTPLVYNLTAQQISTLYGNNNIWSDTGNTSVSYRADTKLFIERLTIPDDVDMIADTNIASGKFFMVGNDLYLSTAAIAAGAQITVGTNANRLSLADALNQINT